MIQVKNICKQYKTGELVQVALDNVSLTLRNSEFVAVLGPSGSGKTTLLNIIGGLDRYDSGDIIIDNVSTKKYKDKDWDSYRNHTIGFVFQSYNLIPHQNLINNVELSLTIGGISKKERKEKALKALEMVGLREQAYKKPNQLSGGQMQRVAIARALVNDPEIVLADEPTGALDTKTSDDVMKILKEISKDRLVVMVTHNPELADEYATRIVNLKDGKITHDSNPVISLKEDSVEHKNFGKAKMGFLTALSLSFHNLLTKKGRTILTAFAGSIGIIGIALILSLSQGFKNYIDTIQEDTLTSYPLTINKETLDFSTAILSMMSGDHSKNKSKDGKLKEKMLLSDMADSIGVNDIKSFKKYLDTNKKTVNKTVSRIGYSYSVSPLIYTMDVTNKLTKLNPSDITNAIYSNAATSMISNNGMGSTFFSVPSDKKVLKDKYNVLEGRLPSKYNEVMIVLNDSQKISDYLSYSLGLRDQNELKDIMAKIMSGKRPDVKNDEKIYTYKELLNIKLKVLNPSEIYRYNDQYSIYEDMRDDTNYMKSIYDKSEDLKIVGIVIAKDDDKQSGVAYTSDLTKHIIADASKSEIVQKQLASPEVDVFSGKSFKDANQSEKQKLDFSSMISVDQEKIASAFNMGSVGDIKMDSISEDQIKDIVTSTANTYAAKLKEGANVTSLTTALTGLNKQIANASIEMYEKAATLGNYLNLAGTDTAASQISADKIKEAISKASLDPAYAGISSMTQMFSDLNYQMIADSIKGMFIDYFNTLKDAKYGYDPNTGFIQVSQNDGIKTYGSANTITSEELMKIALSNGVAVNNTTFVINEIINNYTTYMMAAGIGEATSKAIEPMANSLQNIANSLKGLGNNVSVDKEKLASAFKFNMSEEQLRRIMESMYSSAAEKSKDSNLSKLGYQDIDDPTSISFYFKSFKDKDNFKKIIDKYNKGLKDENKEIEYTDLTGLLMSSVQTIVDSVSYVLIAFVSVSLIVSSIMIAVITLISVMERRKEIGILRAMGASKRNVSSIFNAETFIIGLLSGAVGIGITSILIPGINSIIHGITKNYKINAVLPIKYAITLICISVLLTMLAGFFPSKKASKNDPVVALRSE